jgi:hypothetical protein
MYIQKIILNLYAHTRLQVITAIERLFILTNDCARTDVFRNNDTSLKRKKKIIKFYQILLFIIRRKYKTEKEK